MLNKSYFAIIPANVRYDKDLSAPYTTSIPYYFRQINTKFYQKLNSTFPI